MAFLATGCDSTEPPVVGPPANLEIVSGQDQEAIVGTELPNPVTVKVTDAAGQAVSGQIVNFVVTAGAGSVFAGAAITNAQGQAQERWTLGPTAGAAQTLQARAVDPGTGAPLVFATFNATALPVPTFRYSVTTSVSSATVGSAVTISAQYAKEDGTPVAQSGKTVTWSRTGAGGSLSPSSSTTNASGVATTTLSLDNTMTSASATVTVSDGTWSGEATITVTAGAPSKLVVQATPISAGYGVVLDPLKIAIADEFGNVISGDTRSVSLSLASGTGALEGTLSVAAVNGVATFSDVDILGNGTFAVTASASGLNSATTAAFPVNAIGVVGTVPLPAGAGSSVAALQVAGRTIYYLGTATLTNGIFRGSAAGGAAPTSFADLGGTVVCGRAFGLEMSASHVFTLFNSGCNSPSQTLRQVAIANGAIATIAPNPADTCYQNSELVSNGVVMLVSCHRATTLNRPTPIVVNIHMGDGTRTVLHQDDSLRASIALDATHAFYHTKAADGTFLERVALSGGLPSRVAATIDAVGETTTASGEVIWVELVSGSARIMRAPIATGVRDTLTTLARSVNVAPRRLTVDGGYLYFAFEGALKRLDLSTKAVTNVVADTDVVSFRIAGPSLYWSNTSSLVKKKAK